MNPTDPSTQATTSTDDNPYDLLAQDHDEGHRWAFGTGFADPLAGIDTSVPEQLDPDALARWCLALGDDALIYSHRLQQWVARLPELEEETAVANIALDLLGQARLLLSRAGGITGQTEDQLAFFREEKEFRSVRLAEHADRDFAEVVVRLLIFSTWRLALFEELSSATDPVLAAIAAKGVNELAYHRDYAAQWVIRLGDGTPVSHAKTQGALDTLWPLVGELFRPDSDALAAVAPGAFDAVIDTVLATAGSWPSSSPSPAPTRTRPGDHDDRTDECLPGRGEHARPGTPHAHDRRPRHP
jgi:ring-1,2-phenylacetyl-CoA epoxidase subunit PaaC